MFQLVKGSRIGEVYFAFQKIEQKKSGEVKSAELWGHSFWRQTWREFLLQGQQIKPVVQPRT